jgi:hypothetical protein
VVAIVDVVAAAAVEAEVVPIGDAQVLLTAAVSMVVEAGVEVEAPLDEEVGLAVAEVTNREGMT